MISFTLETDGRLPTGQPLAEAVEQVDRATDGAPAYYMINCAHPTHFEAILDPAAPWSRRLRGLRANASCRSHAELNEAQDLDVGDPVDLGEEVRRAPAATPLAQRPRRLLRHRHAARGRDLRGLDRRAGGEPGLA